MATPKKRRAFNSLEPQRDEPRSSAAGEQKVLEAVQKTLNCPYPLKTTEMRTLWLNVTSARPVDEWRGVDLNLAWHLCSSLAKLNTETQALDEEGTILETQRGTPVLNPRAQMVETLTRRIVMLNTRLRINPTTEGDNGDRKDKLKDEETAREIIERAQKGAKRGLLA